MKTLKYISIMCEKAHGFVYNRNMEETTQDPIEAAINYSMRSTIRTCSKCGKELGPDDFEIRCRNHSFKWPE